MADKSVLLVVNEDSNFIQTVSPLLQSIGCNVLQAPTGLDALRLAQEKKPNLILINHLLPEVDGPALCRQIKAEPALAASSVILLSGLETDPEGCPAEQAAEADDIIVRPFSDREFLARVKILLRLQQVWAERDEALRNLQAASHEAEVQAARRLETEAALRQSQFHLTRMQAIAHIGHWEWQLETGQVTGSDQTFRTLGLEPGFYSPEQVKSLIHPEDKDFCVKSVQAALAEDQTLSIDCRLFSSDGSIRWLHTEGKVVRDEAGRPLKMYGTSQDITARKLAEEALRQSQARLQAILNHTPALIYMKDLQGHYLLVNRTCEQVLGIKNEEIRGKMPQEIFPKEITDQFVVNDARVVASEEPIIVEEIIPQEDGPHTFLSVQFKICDAGGNPEAICGISTDITQRKQHEEALQESQRFIQRVADTVPGILYVFDQIKQRNVYSNRQIGSILGYSIEDIQAMGEAFIPTVVHPDDMPQMPGHLKQLEAAPDNTVLDLQYRMRCADGEWRWLHGRETAFARTEDGRLQQVLGIAQDITGQKQVEEALRRSESNLRALLDATFDSVLLMEPDGTIIDCNQTLAGQFGTDREELLGTNAYELMDQAVAEKRQRYGKQVIASGQPVRFVDNRDGRVLDNSVYPVRDETGQVLRLAIYGRDITGQSRSEEMLREQHQLMEYIIRHDPNAIAVFDKDLRYIFASERYKQDYRVGDRNIIGRHHYEIFPEIPPRWREIHQRVLGGAIERAEEDSFVRPDGSIDYNRWECRPWYRANGEIGGIITYTEVITERKRAEEALRESEERYRTLVEAAPMSILAVQDGRYAFANPVGAERLGYSDPVEIVGVDPLQTIGPEFHPIIQKRIRTTAAGQDNTPLEMDILRPDGTRLTMESVSVAIILNGRPAALIMGQDITERKQAEIALRQSEEKFRALVEQSLDGISLMDQNGVVQEWNPAIEQITGLKRTEVLGQPLWKTMAAIVPEELKAQRSSTELQSRTFEFLHNNQEQPVREYAVQSPAGMRRIVQTVAFPIRIEGGLMAGAISRDVTRQKQSEEALRRYTQRLELLVEIEQGILVARSLEEICQKAVTMVRQAVPCRRATVILFDFAQNELVYTAIDSDQETSLQIETRADLGPYRQTLQQFRQRGLVQIRLSEISGSIPEILQTAGFSTVVAVPLMSQDDLLGSLTLAGDELTLTPEQEELLRQVADKLAIATQQSHLRQQVRRYTERLERRVDQRSRELSALYDVTALATIDVSLETMLTYALEQVLAAMGSQRGHIHLLDETGETLEAVVHRGVAADIIARLEKLSVREPSLQGWVLTQGEPVIVPSIAQDPRAKQIERLDDFAFAAAPIQAREQKFGVLSVVRSSREPLFSVEELTLLTAIADHIGVVVESARLRRQAERSAVLEERERLARDLHDSVTQSLYSLTLFAEWALRLCHGGELEAAKKRLVRISEAAQQSLKEMRLLLYELRPGLLEQDGLTDALQRRLEAVEKRVGVEVRFEADPLERLPAEIEEGLYRIAQEGLNNALKHAAATLVEVELRRTAEGITLTVRDNGIGFDPAGTQREGRLGLSIMQERAKQLGGKLSIASKPDQGTTITITIEDNQ